LIDGHGHVEKGWGPHDDVWSGEIYDAKATRLLPHQSALDAREDDAEPPWPTGKRSSWPDAQWKQFREYDAWERRREDERQAVIDERRQWIKKRGVKRLANMVAARLTRKGFRVEVNGTDSQYVSAYETEHDTFIGDVRVSLHQQAPGGEFNVGTQARMGEALASIDPHTTTTVDQAVQAVVDESLDSRGGDTALESRWPESLREIRSGKATSAMPVGDATELFLSGLGKKKVSRIKSHLGVEEMPTLVTVRPSLINSKSASGFLESVDPSHRIPDYVWDDIVQYLSDPLAITEHHDERSGEPRLNVWIRSALRQPHRRGLRGPDGVEFNAPIMIGIALSLGDSRNNEPPSLTLTTAFAQNDMDRLKALTESGKVIAATPDATKTKQRNKSMWSIADGCQIQAYSGAKK